MARKSYTPDNPPRKGTARALWAHWTACMGSAPDVLDVLAPTPRQRESGAADYAIVAAHVTYYVHDAAATLAAPITPVHAFNSTYYI